MQVETCQRAGTEFRQVPLCHQGFAAPGARPGNTWGMQRQINYSLEFLVDNLTPTPYCDLANINNTSTSKKGNNSLIKALLICDKNSTWQRDMEDRFIVLDNHESRSDTCFLEILDGCHGVTATETIVAKLPLLFLEQLSHIDSSYKNKNNKEQILEFFATVIKADYREKEKKTDNEETNKTSRKCTMKVYAKSFRMQIFTVGVLSFPKFRSGCSVVKIIPSEEMDGTGEEEKKHSENNTHSLLARTAKGVAGLLHIAIIGKYIPHQNFFPFIQLKTKKKKGASIN
ncbi:LOW QUALITY PROTEIN: protein phosphatase 2C-like domain-containing protein 1 [Acridotheres tristis]